MTSRSQLHSSRRVNYYGDHKHHYKHTYTCMLHVAPHIIHLSVIQVKNSAAVSTTLPQKHLKINRSCFCLATMQLKPWIHQQQLLLPSTPAMAGSFTSIHYNLLHGSDKSRLAAPYLPRTLPSAIPANPAIFLCSRKGHRSSNNTTSTHANSNNNNNNNNNNQTLYLHGLCLGENWTLDYAPVQL